MKADYPQMFSPITIGGVNFRNRIWTGPASAPLLQGREEYMNEYSIAYYANKAAGGAACITVSAQNMDIYRPYDPVHANENIFHMEGHRFWNQLTDAIHFHGAKASLELLGFAYHGFDAKGNLIEYSVNEEPGKVMLTRESMAEIAELYADTAENAVKCGFDMIMIHGGHGLVISQILSPIYNTRTDEFGGSLENRAKFPIMILDAIRKRVGRKLLIEYRVSGSELLQITSTFIENLVTRADGSQASTMDEEIARKLIEAQDQRGFTTDDCIDYLEMIQDKIDIAHISAGSFWSDTEHIMHPNHYLPAGVNTYLASYIKKSGRIHIPILTLGGYQMPEDLERAISEGHADLVATVRGSIADCGHVKKAMLGKEEEIIPCIRCFHCLDYGRTATFGCSVNPTVGRELRYERLSPGAGSLYASMVGTCEIERFTAHNKRVLVIGGGPAGMSAAITAKRKGHEVLLVEKSGGLGGRITYANQVPFKKDVKKFLDYQKRMVEKLGIEVQFETEADEDFIKAYQPDVILVAVGGKANVPAALAKEQPNVIGVSELYEKLHCGETEIVDKKKVVIVGGGEAGCELSIHLARAYESKCTIVEMTRQLCAESFSIPQEADVEAMRAAGVRTHMRTICDEITGEGVVCRDYFGRSFTEPADLIVLATGFKNEPAAFGRFASLAAEVIEIGDCRKVGNIRTAVRDGYEAAVRI